MAKKQKAKSINANIVVEVPTTPEDELMPILPAPPAKPEGKIPQVLVVPEAVDGIQMNFCKNPSCANFSMPAAGARTKGGRPRSAAPRTPARSARYKPSGGDNPFIQCQACGECPPIKSNRGIKEELDRMTAPLDASVLSVYCRTETCANHINRVSVSTAGYRRFGKSEIGSPRWQCRICGKTVSSPQKAIHRQQASHKNVSILLDLVNKVPLKCLARTNRISMKTVYNKIDFIYKQCVAFAAHRERELPNLRKRWLEISVDRQEHLVNWFKAGNKKNIRLHAIASVDNRSGYVFGSHLNYDPSLNLKNIEAEMYVTKDHRQLAPFRKYARLWLRGDFHKSVIDGMSGLTKAQKKARHQSVMEQVEAIYKAAAERTDVEAYDALDAYCRLPEWGSRSTPNTRSTPISCSSRGSLPAWGT